MVADWVSDLSRNRSADIKSIIVPNGTIHAVEFATSDPESGIGRVWVAVPGGAGWPAALTVGAERFTLSLYRMKAGDDDAVPSQHIDLYRCSARRVLASVEQPMALSDANLAARTALTAYLSNPDQYNDNPDGDISTCVWPERMLPRPAG